MFSHKKSEHIANLFVKEECRNKPHLLLSRRKIPCVYIFCSIPQWKISCLEKNEWHARQPLTFLGITFAVLHRTKTTFEMHVAYLILILIEIVPTLNVAFVSWKKERLLDTSWQTYFRKKAFTMWVNKKGQRIEGQIKKIRWTFSWPYLDVEGKKVAIGKFSYMKQITFWYQNFELPDHPILTKTSIEWGTKRLHFQTWD